MANKLNNAIGTSLLWLATVLGLTSACSGSDAGSMGATSFSFGGTSDNGLSNTNPETIGFSPANTARLLPSATASFAVIVQPAGTYKVGLALLGASNDASLSETVVRTGPDGQAQFSVTAPSIATSFAVRASAGQLSRQLDISVSEDGYASLRVTGNYAGNRSIEKWVATVKTGGSCADYGSSLPDDGTLRAESTTASNIVVTSVPVGAVQSLILRGDFSVWGCKDIPTLVTDASLDFPIQVFDIPASYSANPIAANFAVTTNAATWAANLTTASSRLREAFFDSTTDDAALLLDAMQNSAADPLAQSEFAQRSVSGNWPVVLATEWSALAGGSSNCISFAIDSWLDSALKQIASGVYIATSIALTTTSSSLDPEQLNLRSIAGVPPDDLQSAVSFPVKTTLGANDSLAMSSELSFSEANLIRAIAIEPATQQHPSAKDIPSALSSLLGCDTLGARLDEAAPTVTSCDAGCLGQLCNNALLRLWTQTDSVAAQWGVTRLTLSSSGNLVVDANAMVTGYNGTWVGVISSPSGSISSGGIIR